MKSLVFLTLVACLCVACSKGEPKLAFSDLPTGNPQAGSAVFQNGADGAVACTTCHSVDGANGTGPSMEGFGARAEGSDDSLSATEYTYESIIRPSKHVVNGFSNLMPNNYEEKLTPQQLADLIAYLLSL